MQATSLTASEQELLVASAIDLRDPALEGVGLETVREYDRLPDSLKKNIRKSSFSHDAPFLMTTLDGHAAQSDDVYAARQIRSDLHNDKATAESAETHKALQGDKGSHIVTTPFMTARWRKFVAEGKPYRLMIQEGTRQGIAASQFARHIDDLVVIIIWGCNNFASSRDDGTAHPALDRFMDGASEVIISLDGDRLSKAAVWDGADRLATIAESNGLKRNKTIKYIVLPGTRSGHNTAGLDDIMGATNRPLRDKKFARLLEAATTKAGRRPAEKKKDGGSSGSLTPVIHWDAAVIREPDVMFKDSVVPGPVLAEFAVRITETRSTVDDLRPNARPLVEHDLEVKFPDGLVVTLNGWPDADLSKIELLLESAAPGGRATTLEYDTDTKTPRLIAAAIRAYDDGSRVFRSILTRTGLTTLPDGRLAFLFDGGAMTADGITNEGAAQLPEKYIGALRLVDATEDEYTDAVQTLHATVADAFIDPTAFWASWSAQVAAALDMTPLGTLALVGRTASGKTATVANCQSAYGPAFAYRNKTFVGESLRNGTRGFLNSAGKGLHNVAMVLEDARLVANRNQRQTLIEILQTHLSMGMGDSPRGRQVSDGRGNYRTKIDSYERPWRLLTAETITALEFIESDFNRMLSIEMTAANSFRPGGADAMDRIAEDGTINMAFSAFVRWMLGEFRTREGLNEHTRSTFTAALKRLDEVDGLNLSSRRQVEVLAANLTGTDLWFKFLYANKVRVQVELDTPRDADEFANRSSREWRAKQREGMHKAAIAHDRLTRTAGNDERTSILERTIAAVASQRAILIESSDDGTLFDRNTPVIGARSAGAVKNPHTGEMEHAVYLNHAAIAELLHESIAAVRAGLEEIAVKAPTSKGWRVRIRSVQVQVTRIPASAWDVEGDDLPATAEFLDSLGWARNNEDRALVSAG